MKVNMKKILILFIVCFLTSCGSYLIDKQYLNNETKFVFNNVDIRVNDVFSLCKKDNKYHCDNELELPISMMLFAKLNGKVKDNVMFISYDKINKEKNLNNIIKINLIGFYDIKSGDNRNIGTKIIFAKDNKNISETDSYIFNENISKNNTYSNLSKINDKAERITKKLDYEYEFINKFNEQLYKDIVYYIEKSLQKANSQ